MEFLKTKKARKWDLKSEYSEISKINLKKRKAINLKNKKQKIKNDKNL